MGRFWGTPLWRRKALAASPEVLESAAAGNLSFFPLIAVPNRSDMMRAAFERMVDANYGWMYTRQPAVRAVVDFMARNVAQLALRLYERTSDIERHEASDHPAAESMRNPNLSTPGQQFIFDLVRDHLVYGNAFALKFRTGNLDAPISLTQLPPARTSVLGPSYFTVDAYRIYRADGTHFDVDPGDIFHWRGAANPDDPRLGLSPLETLRQTLAEDAASQAANVELLKSGLLKPGYISRPLDAPQWKEETAERFQEKWGNALKDSGRHTPILEEGMAFNDFGVSPKDAEMLSGRRFTIEEVCRVYGVPRGLLGIAEGATLSEEHSQFYADVLPPICEMLASYLDLSILKAEFEATKHYFEFDLDEKLMGNERLTALTSASGAPVLTRNESRAMLNKPPKKGGDELITPMNVTVGGKPSPMVMPIQDPNKPAQDGSARNGNQSMGVRKALAVSDEMLKDAKQIQDYIDRKSDDWLEPDGTVMPDGQVAVLPKQADVEAKAMLLLPRRIAQARRRDRSADDFTDLLRNLFESQEKSMRLKAAKDFEVERWVKALGQMLLKLMRSTVEREGGKAAVRYGLADFTLETVEHYLEATAEGKALEINLTTRDALQGGNHADVFATAHDVWAPGIGTSLATHMNAFSQIEPAKLAPDASFRQKRWIVTSDNSAHPEMNGEETGLTERFSNGKQYPPYEHPHCECLVEVI